MAPPRTWEVRAKSGLLVATAKGMIEPLDGGTRSRVTITLDFTGHGIGKLLVPLVVRRQVKRALPRNEQKLKVAHENRRSVRVAAGVGAHRGARSAPDRGHMDNVVPSR
jgi:hypothetical protein